MHRRLVNLLACIAACLACFTASAEPFGQPVVVQIGRQAVRLPTPEGFVETSRTSQELWNLALSFTAGDARMVAHFVTANDLQAFERGQTVVLKQFMLAQTPRRAESVVATQAQFDKLRAGTVDLQRNLASRLEPKLAAEVEKVSKGLSSAQASSVHIRLGEIVPVSVDRNDPQVLIYTILSQVGASDGKSNSSQSMVSTAAYCLVSGKVVMLTAYRHFRSPKDLQASRNFVNSWANALVAAN